MRFATELFQREVERLFALEENDGYMERVVRLHPERTDDVEALKREHDQLRADLRHLIVRLGRTTPSALVELDLICRWPARREATNRGA